jgi:short subunit dehydrogenase-like uncharacterized protein
MTADLGATSWMIYGAAGHTGGLIARRAHERGHRPLLAGRGAPDIAALADTLDVPHRAVSLDDADALRAALADVDVVLNTAGPFVHTATALAAACLDVGVHYLDISNELQVFRSLYDLHARARSADVTIVPGVGFGVVATNCLARYVNDAVGGAEQVEVAARPATAHAGPGVTATWEANASYGGWIRRAGELQPEPLGAGTTTISFPTGPCSAMPVPTGDLEAAFRATDAPDVTAYLALPEPEAPDEVNKRPPKYSSYGWARATRTDGFTAEAWLRTGESYAFTADAAVTSVELTLTGTRSGAWSPAEAFGTDLILRLPNTARLDTARSGRAADLT